MEINRKQRKEEEETFGKKGGGKGQAKKRFKINEKRKNRK
jgi:hypothetical protein